MRMLYFFISRSTNILAVGRTLLRRLIARRCVCVRLIARSEPIKLLAADRPLDHGFRSTMGQRGLLGLMWTSTTWYDNLRPHIGFVLAHAYCV